MHLIHNISTSGAIIGTLYQLSTMKEDQNILALCEFISDRLRAERIRLKHSQQEMSKLCGIPLRTYKRLELSGKGTIENLVRALVATNRVKALDLLFPIQQITRTNYIDRMEDLAKTVIERSK